MPEPLTMTPAEEAVLRVTGGNYTVARTVFDEIDALRARIAELESALADAVKEAADGNRELIAEIERRDSQAMRSWAQLGMPGGGNEGGIMHAMASHILSLRSEVERLRPWATFGASAFEDFWHDAEPGDLDAGDLQDSAIKAGLLRRRTEADAGKTCGGECGCEWEEGRSVDECECLFPAFPPLTPEAPDAE